MARKQFIVTLREEVVLSRNAATFGGHATLDYLPGSVFLGAVAAHLYADPDLSLAEKYLLFHSGKVRFGNGLPLSPGGYVAYPAPRCWFGEKSKPPCRENIENYARAEFPSDRQLQQYRDGYVALHPRDDRELVRVVPRFRMKTAIDPDTGLAAEQQLFGYSALPAGSAFSFVLAADDDVADQLFARVVKTLLSAPLRLGRSRSAEYGAVRIEEAHAGETLRSAPVADTILVWLLADLALRDPYGAPTLRPEPELLGLPAGWQLDLGKTFLHSRSYAPYNAKYRRREPARDVLTMGGVICCVKEDDAVPSLTGPEVAALQERGLGLYRQAGLGRVWINPPVLETFQPQFAEVAPVRQPARATVPPKPADNLVLRYLERRVASIDKNEQVSEQAALLQNELVRLYKSAWSMQPHAAANVGPSPTQWGRVMEATKNAMGAGAVTTADLPEILFNAQTGICKQNDPQWDTQVVRLSETRVRVSTFRQWFREQFTELGSSPHHLEIMTLFARLAMDTAREHSCFLPQKEGAHE